MVSVDKIGTRVYIVADVNLLSCALLIRSQSEQDLTLSLSVRECFQTSPPSLIWVGLTPSGCFWWSGV